MVVQRPCSTRCRHLEVESLLVLKNNRGVEGNRVRHMDYGSSDQQADVHPSAEREDITLFSRPTSWVCTTPSSPIRTSSSVCTPKYEKDDSIRKQRVKAVDLFSPDDAGTCFYRPYLHPER